MVATALPRRHPNGIRIDSSASALDGFLASQVQPCAKPLGVAQPTSEAQVDALVQWANEHDVPLVPVSSRGGPRLRGDTRLTVPALVVDLSALKRVIHVDGRNRIALIEPGVTFTEFDAALRPHGLRAFRPLMPREGKSVLATYLEREPITVPNEHWDTTDPLAALSVTFGNGSHFRTGGASIPGTIEENLARGHRQMMAAGPVATDFTRVMLGSQGALGIVSWASIYCEAIPAREQPQLYGADDFSVVAELARRLLLRQVGAQCFIVDRMQLAAVLAGKEQACAAAPRWLLFVNLTSPDYLPDQHMAWQSKEVASLVATCGAKPLASGQGVSGADVASRLWQSTPTPYQNGPRGQYRDVFCLTQLDKVEALLASVAPTLDAAQAAGDLAHGVYVQPTVQGVSCHLCITLFHARGAAAQAEKIESQLVETLAAAGGFFSRPYGAWAKVAYGRDPAIVPHLRRVKQMFDPKGLLNPGRLCF